MEQSSVGHQWRALGRARRRGPREVARFFRALALLDEPEVAAEVCLLALEAVPLLDDPLLAEAAAAELIRSRPAAALARVRRARALLPRLDGARDYRRDVDLLIDVLDHAAGGGLCNCPIYSHHHVAPELFDELRVLDAEPVLDDAQGYGVMLLVECDVCNRRWEVQREEGAQESSYSWRPMA